MSSAAIKIQVAGLVIILMYGILALPAPDTASFSDKWPATPSPLACASPFTSHEVKSGRVSSNLINFPGQCSHSTRRRVFDYDVQSSFAKSPEKHLLTSVVGCLALDLSI